MRIAIVTARSLRATGFATRVTTMLRHYKDFGFEMDVYHYRFAHEGGLPDDLAASVDTYVEIPMERRRVQQHCSVMPPLAWSVGHARAVRTAGYDIVQAETPAVWSAAKAIDARRRICVFHDDDAARLTSLVEGRAPSIGRARLMLTAYKYARWQRRVLHECDEAWFASDVERARLINQAPDLLCRTVPNGAADEYWSVSPPSPDSRVVLFVGPASYSPNRTGMHWFVERVWPAVAEQLPGVELRVVGEGWGGRRAEAVRFEGFVPSLVPEYQTASVVIAPLFGGGGTKVKVIEAMASGRPVVTTSFGAAALPRSEGLTVCDDPARFARGVVAYLMDRPRSDAAGLANRRAVDHLRWSTIWRGAADHISSTMEDLTR